MRRYVPLVALILLVPAGAVASPPPPWDGSPIAYVRAGDVYTTPDGRHARRLTTGHESSRPRWSPDGTRIAYLRAGRLWTMVADGTAPTPVPAGAVKGGAAWSPDGGWLAYLSVACGLCEIRATAPYGAPVPLVADVGPGRTGPGLPSDYAVAWSPDGSRIAFRDGGCAGQFDECLGVYDLVAHREDTVDAYAGGPMPFDGYGVAPAFSPDSRRVAWTAYCAGAPDIAGSQVPVHVAEADVDGADRRWLGVAGDREAVYAGASGMLLTSTGGGTPWITALDPVTNRRTALLPGTQPDARPLR